MIKKRNRGFNDGLPAAIKIYFNGYIGFGCTSLNAGLSHNHSRDDALSVNALMNKLYLPISLFKFR
ncbi:hypothetical cytosolic protein [Syntrophus aciditrophicus SB]|uniref:Hypothetical cytosolic protein n=1 Tax=Syntrophus aciditrophicus (strain SB) TaxID=56780 RepID=Q2LVF4_SYNAS|nr:hypothetical cytosolic protein [Syntrophus aciditrophicus SB]